MTDENQDHMTFSISDRGFRYMPPLPLVNGGRIRVHESSNASRPCVWVNISEPAYNEPNAADHGMAVQLHVADALRLRDQLDHLIRYHYAAPTND